MARRYPIRFIASLAMTLGLMAVAPTGAADGANDPPPLRRVILICCDTLRSASLPTYGNPGPLATTGLDSLASEGALFLRCTTPMGWTLPAHVAMFTGLSPGTVRAAADRPVPPSIRLLPERLAAAGFLCAGFPANNHWLEAHFGFARGMLQYRAQGTLAPTDHWLRGWSFADLLQRDPAGASFYLFFHFMDNHTVAPDLDYPLPYWTLREVDLFYHGVQAPLPPRHLTADGRWDLEAYDPDLLRRAYHATVHSVDLHRLRPLLARLREDGLTENTMVIVTADHGEEIGEHGGFLHASPHAEVREVPLIVVWPGVVPAGKVVFSPVSLLDLTPTILDYAGLPPPERAQGRSLRPLLDGELDDPPPPFPSRDFLIDGHRRGLALEASALIGLEAGTWWSLVAMTDTTGCAGTFRPARAAEVLGLYDLDRDPAETTDLKEQRPEIVAALRARLDAALAEEARLAELVHEGVEPPPAPLDEVARRKLRALGY
jgi:arylsulfatase A-like enzyme